jgi:hypothetical protein
MPIAVAPADANPYPHHASEDRTDQSEEVFDRDSRRPASTYANTPRRASSLRPCQARHLDPHFVELARDSGIGTRRQPHPRERLRTSECPSRY